MKYLIIFVDNTSMIYGYKKLNVLMIHINMDITFFKLSCYKDHNILFNAYKKHKTIFFNQNVKILYINF